MRAVAVYEDGKIQLVDIPQPNIGDYECLVQVKACGLCNGTDLKIIDNAVADVDVTYPTILGHEGVGKIIQTGSKVRHLKVGDRIVCPIGSQDPINGFTFTWGGMSEYNITHDIQAIIEDGAKRPEGFEEVTELDYLGKTFPDHISYEDAVMILTFKENYSALLNFGIKEGDDVLVIGDGPVGCGIVNFLKIIGADNIVVTGLLEDRLNNIKELTGVPTINTTGKTLESVLGDQRFDFVIDAVGGNIAIAKEGAQFLRPGGKLCLYGVLAKEHANINMFDIPNNTSMQILNWPHQEHRTHDQIIQWIDEGKIRPKNFYSHVMPVEDVAKAVEMTKAREAYKVILTF